MLFIGATTGFNNYFQSEPGIMAGDLDGFSVGVWFIPLVGNNADRTLVRNRSGAGNGWAINYITTGPGLATVQATVGTSGGDIVVSGEISACNAQELLLVLVVPEQVGFEDVQLWANGSLIASALLADPFVPAPAEPTILGEAGWPQMYYGGLGYYDAPLDAQQVPFVTFSMQQSGRMSLFDYFVFAEDNFPWTYAWDGLSLLQGGIFAEQTFINLQPITGDIWAPRSGDEVLTKVGADPLMFFNVDAPGNWAQTLGGSGQGGGALQAAYDAGPTIDATSGVGAVQLSADLADPVTPLLLIDGTNMATVPGPALAITQPTLAAPDPLAWSAIELTVQDPATEVALIRGRAATAVDSPGTGLRIQAGNGDGTGPGGPVLIQTGDAGGSVGSSGAILLLQGGDGGTDGDGGAIAITGGGSANGLPGDIDITGGQSTTQIGGRVQITAGAGGGASDGGELRLVGGLATGTGAGGDTNLAGGAADGTGDGGYVRISAGSSVGGARGGIFFQQQLGGSVDFTYEATTRHFGALDVNGTLRIASVTTTQRDAMALQQGLLVYNTTTAQFQGYNGATWDVLGP